MQENFFKKIYWNLYQITNLLKNWFLFLFSKKGQKDDKNKFVKKAVGIIVRLFSSKNISQIASKTFEHSVFSMITWITKL